MITSTIHVLINVPIIFYMLKARQLRQSTLVSSGSAASQIPAPAA